MDQVKSAINGNRVRLFGAPEVTRRRNKESWRWLARLWVGERRRGAGKVSLLFMCEVLGEKCTENKGLERPMM